MSHPLLHPSHSYNCCRFDHLLRLQPSAQQGCRGRSPAAKTADPPQPHPDHPRNRERSDPEQFRSGIRNHPVLWQDQLTPGPAVVLNRGRGGRGRRGQRHDADLRLLDPGRSPEVEIEADSGFPVDGGLASNPDREGVQLFLRASAKRMKSFARKTSPRSIRCRYLLR